LEFEEEELNATTFQSYLYLVKVGKPIGPRDLMRGANLSSPSVAYRNLQKLIDLGLVVKDQYGNYVVKEKKSMKGYIWFGKTLIPSFVVFGLIFIGILICEIVILIPHLLMSSPIQESFWLLTLLTVVSAGIFIVQGWRFKRKT
jgi:pilus assembly protein TadC